MRSMPPEIPWAAAGQIGFTLAVVVWLIVHYDARIDAQSREARREYAELAGEYQKAISASTAVMSELVFLVKGITHR